MRTLFKPAIKLMSRLSFGKKFIVLGVLSLLAMLMVFTILFSSLNVTLTRSQLELQGLEKVKLLSQTIELIQRERALRVAVEAGMPALQDTLTTQTAKITAIFAELENHFVVTSPATDKSVAALTSIKNHWSALNGTDSQQTLLYHYQEYNQLLDEFLNLENLIGDENALYTDAELNTYHLITLMLYESPIALEDISRLHAYSLVPLIKRQISPQEKQELTVLTAKVAQSSKYYQRLVVETAVYNPDLQIQLQANANQLLTTANLLSEQIVPDLLAEHFPDEAMAVYHQLIAAIDSIYAQQYTHFLPATVQLINQRLAKAQVFLLLSIAIPCLVFLLIFYFAIGAHLSVTDSLNRLAIQARAFTNGDLQARIEVTSQDEIGWAAANINLMADGFCQLYRIEQQHKIRIRNIINSALDAVIQLDSQAHILFWNLKAEQILGWPAEQVLGKTLQTLVFSAGTQNLFLNALAAIEHAVNDAPEVQHFEGTAQHYRGHFFPIELAIVPNHTAQQLEYTVFMRDVTLHKQALEILTNSEQRYRSLFESSMDAIMTLSRTRGFLSANPAAITLFGCRTEREFLHHSPETLSPELQPNGVPSIDLATFMVEKAFAEGGASFEWLHKRVSGETFYAEVQLSRVNITDEVVLLATVRDITISKRDRAALMTSEARTRAVLRTMSDAVVLIDSKGQMLLFNDALCEMYGYEEEELLGQNVKILMPEPYYSEHDGYLQRLELTQERAIIGRRIEVNGKRKDGHLMPIELSVSELFDDLGSTFIGVMRDITQRKAYEESQRAARQEAERLVQVKSDFLANMSHEIRTPLNAIIGLARMSLRDQLGQKPYENYRRIHEAGMHLLNLVNDILDFSKIEAGKMVLDIQPMQLNQLLNNALQLVELRASEKNLQLLVERPVDLPEWVLGDELRIRQIIVNLLSNAIKFTNQGFVSLNISRDDKVYAFKVTDSGIGINPEQLSRLFTAFEQADSSTTRKFGGSGLGLAISRNLANIMGGDIHAASVLGQGSEFTLVLELISTERGGKVISSNAVSGSRLTGLKILAAEDVELNRLVLEDVLLHEGAEVVFAENGLQALELLGNQTFDLVLMDIQMPIMDGYTAARQISFSYPNLLIIGLTAHAMPEERQRCLESGMRERVTKPVDADILVNAIWQHLPAELRPVLNNFNQPSAELAATLEKPVQAVVTTPLLPAATPLYINWPALRVRFEGREDFIRKLIGKAVDGSLQEHIDKLQTALTVQNQLAIQQTAHALKGLAGIFEAAPLLQQATAVEQAVKLEQPDCYPLTLQLMETCKGVLNELENYLRT